MTADIVTFLNQRLEDQRHTANGLRTLAGTMPAETAAWLNGIADGLAADVDGKRRILAEHEHFNVGGYVGCRICALNSNMNEIEPDGWCTTTRLLALPHATHPDYQQEWKP